MEFTDQGSGGGSTKLMHEQCTQMNVCVCVCVFQTFRVGWMIGCLQRRPRAAAKAPTRCVGCGYGHIFANTVVKATGILNCDWEVCGNVLGVDAMIH
eukprot:5297689-Amphidinium_carterae.1